MLHFMGGQLQREIAEVHEVHIAALQERDTTIHDMEKKVKISQTFLEQKDSLDATLENLQLTLEQERKQHERAIRWLQECLLQTTRQLCGLLANNQPGLVSCCNCVPTRIDIGIFLSTWIFHVAAYA